MGNWEPLTQSTDKLPPGTKVRAANCRGYWLKTDSGWQWCNGITRPTPEGATEVWRESDLKVSCEFCDAKAVYTDCLFWPATQDGSITGPFDLCDTHYHKMDELYGSTGDEQSVEAISPMAVDIDKLQHETEYW